MLELDKQEFTKRMKFNINIPKVLVKLSNTYYSKLSTMAKTIIKDGHNENANPKKGKEQRGH
jgi:hypothetical protein